MINRREFLKSSALGLATLSMSSPWQISWATEKTKKARYVIAMPSSYWNIDQKLDDIKKVKTYKQIPAYTHKHSPGLHTVFLVVEEEGKNAQYISVPGSFHSVTASKKHNLIYLLGDMYQSKIVALDADTLELVSFAGARSTSDEKQFCGHAIAIPGTDILACGSNQNKVGAFDEISFRDAKTLKELHRFSTYGFDLHDVRLSLDNKYLLCAHYGSYVGRGAYDALRVYNAKALVNPPPKHIYPASVTWVDIKTGKREKLLSDLVGGQQGHAVADEKNNTYLANQRALLVSRPNLESHKKFQEGLQAAEDNGEFAMGPRSHGISVRYDEKFQEVLIAPRTSLKMQITKVPEQSLKSVDLAGKLPWAKPSGYIYTSGLEFHPDGKHYILSTSDGFIAVERGTHVVNPKKSFPLALKIHAHMYIV